MSEQSEFSEAAKALPEIKQSSVTVSREEKLAKFLDIIDDIEYTGEYAIMKFNAPVIIASEGNIAVVAKNSMTLKTVDGVLNLN